MNNIERNMSSDELKKLSEDGIPGVDLRNRSLTNEQKFKLELIKHEQKATKEEKPFARHVALDDLKDYQDKVKMTIKRMGYLPDNFPEFKIDWSKYSRLSNFKVVKESERPDTNLSNKNPGLNVTCKTTEYRYTGYDNRYIIMESGPSSITRAVKNRAKLDKEVAKELKEASK